MGSHNRDFGVTLNHRPSSDPFVACGVFRPPGEQQEDELLHDRVGLLYDGDLAITCLSVKGGDEEGEVLYDRVRLLHDGDSATTFPSLKGWDDRWKKKSDVCEHNETGSSYLPRCRFCPPFDYIEAPVQLSEEEDTDESLWKSDSSAEAAQSSEEETDETFLQSESSDEFPDYPFLRSAGLFSVSPMYTGHSYVQQILQSLGEANVPRTLQAIIKGCDFQAGETTSQLSGLLEKFKSQCNVMSSEEGKIIEGRLTDAVNKMLHTLRNLDTPIFKGATAVLLGSCAERTKIVSPDEFDFVIFVPYLWKIYKHEFPVGADSEVIPLTTVPIDEKKNLESVLMKFKPEEESDGRFCDLIGGILQTTAAEAFKTALEDVGFKFKDQCDRHQTAIPLCFTYSSLDIKVDLCIGIRDEDEVSKPRDSMLVRPLEEQPRVGFYILRNQEAFPTSTFSEVRFMRDLPHNTRLCFQLTKCLATNFIPSQYTQCKCDRSVVPSFQMKLILYYMWTYYEEEEFWSDEHLSSRVLEMYIVFGLCLRFGTNNNKLSPFRERMVLIGKYLRCGNIPEATVNIENTFIPESIKQCQQALSAFVENKSAFNTFINIFFNESDSGVRRLDADIMSVFCEFLYNLKKPQYATSDFPVTIPSHEDESRTETNRTTQERDKSVKDLREQWNLTIDGGVSSILVPRDRDGELIVATGLMIPTKVSRLLKYNTNEVIQGITLPSECKATCYYNGCITVAVENNMCITYDYVSFTMVSSFSTKQIGQCKGIARLEDGFAMSFENKKEIRKITTEGVELYSSEKMFDSPSRVITLKDGHGVAVCDRHAVVGLSSDLRCKLFHFPQESPLRSLDVSWDSENSYIFVRGVSSITVITCEGISIRKWEKMNLCNIPIICYDAYHHCLLQLMQITDFSSKIMVYRC